jgi:hypothetical protein
MVLPQSICRAPAEHHAASLPSGVSNPGHESGVAGIVTADSGRSPVSRHTHEHLGPARRAQNTQVSV